MSKCTYIGLVFGVVLVGCAEGPSLSKSTKGDRADVFADSLLALMTLEEKAGQMTNLSLMTLAEGEFWDRRDTVILDTAKMRLYIKEHGVGSFQNLGTYPFPTDEWRLNIDLIHKYVQENTRLNIPVLYGIDAVHGANYTAGSTMFPHQIGLAATFNPKIVSEVGRITSYEMRASGIPWNYGPVLDVSKEPLWGRIFETFGEDSYLASELSLAMLRGGGLDSLESPYSTLACLKHFLGYGATHNGKDRSPVYLPERNLREDYLPPFKRAVEAGALSIMVSSNAVNGIPCHASKFLLTDLLKNELGFDGLVISDWNDIDNLVIMHQIAVDEREAVKLSVNAGLDMCMEPYDASFADHLIDLVNDGEVPISRVDDAVRRILKVKYKLGLFENTQTSSDLYPEFASSTHTEANYNAAVESITLLKNENEQLPIKEGKKVLITGVAANSINYLNGAWSRTWRGVDTTFNDREKKTVLNAFQDALGKKNVLFAEGTTFDEDVNTSKAVQLASGADHIIVCLGEIPATEKPSDTDELAFPDVQLELVKKLAKTGKPITLVLIEARPRLIKEIEPLSGAILTAYLPGNEGGRAISDALLGNINPSGKLPYTYPKHSGSIWSYDHVKADIRDGEFGFEGYDPQFEFGHGLSYTQFEYSVPELSADTIHMDETLEVKIEIKNTGDREGSETALLFVSDLTASVVPKIKRLRGFEKISLEPGNSETITFKLDKEDFSFINTDNKSVVEEGLFRITLGGYEKDYYLTTHDNPRNNTIKKDA